ncbi:hypothetical protein CIHG_07392 [Coccidioides immitis H538.4]|uniref:Uncharacterized protein n=1 Tax=Coccidioides immitis H538.4 TaxID=396776 RepID=A0A0J8RYB0_COCIT|nr:hypothetical protein CIHG_07392 [Coccidioides immitis H538.4]
MTQLTIVSGNDKIFNSLTLSIFKADATDERSFDNRCSGNYSQSGQKACEVWMDVNICSARRLAVASGVIEFIAGKFAFWRRRKRRRARRWADDPYSRLASSPLQLRLQKLKLAELAQVAAPGGEKAGCHVPCIDNSRHGPWETFRVAEKKHAMHSTGRRSDLPSRKLGASEEDFRVNKMPLCSQFSKIMHLRPIGRPSLFVDSRDNIERSMATRIVKAPVASLPDHAHPPNG